MIKDNQRLFNRLHVVLDALVTAAAYIASYFIRFESPLADRRIYHLPFATYMVALPFLVPVCLLLYNQFDLYSSKRVSGRKREFINIVYANAILLIAFISVLYVINQPDFARSMIAIT